MNLQQDHSRGLEINFEKVLFRLKEKKLRDLDFSLSSGEGDISSGPASFVLYEQIVVYYTHMMCVMRIKTATFCCCF